MTQDPEDPPPHTDGDKVVRELRRQLEVVKALMAHHREVMRAAGLTLTGEDPGKEGAGA